MPDQKPQDLTSALNRRAPLLPVASAEHGYLLTRHGKLGFARRTLIMGIVNVTPDSFFDGGQRLDPTKAVADGAAMAASGADIIDVGGESTRPGAPPVAEEEELARVLPVVRGLRREVTVPISIDTYKSSIARAALDGGADIVNDISALRFDPKMISLVAAEKVPAVLMHMQGTPRTMQQEPRYRDVVREVRDFLVTQLHEAMDAGVAPEAIIIDPGIGFGKTIEHNLQLLRGLPVLAALGQPLLVGVSRKAFIGKILNATPDERLEGSLAAAVAVALAGANILRVHDVAETCKAVKIADAIRFGFPR
ncbi:MAG: dihydropteroate synthase [Deltaproteobacteria bacterium]|nr:MAG: dihydropteroate synthase [Deltaproteobacteria bacterium]